MGTNTLLPLVTIIPALIGSGLISAGFIIHPLITINPKERGLSSKDISIWQITGKASNMAMVMLVTICRCCRHTFCNQYATSKTFATNNRSSLKTSSLMVQMNFDFKFIKLNSDRTNRNVKSF